MKLSIPTAADQSLRREWSSADSQLVAHDVNGSEPLENHTH